jgi:peroxiredoxin
MNRICILSFLLIFPVLLPAVIPAGGDAPPFFLTDQYGKDFFLSKHAGKRAKQDLKSHIVISFFASWCIICKEEIKLLHELQNQYPNIKFYLINVEEPNELVKKYIEANQIKLDVLMDRYSIVAKKYGVVDDKNIAHLPSLCIISADGTLVYSQEGFQEKQKNLLIEQLNQLE